LKSEKRVNGLDSVDDDGVMDRVDKSEATSGSAMVEARVVADFILHHKMPVSIFIEIINK
jgi:hypothetical protein